MKIKQFIKEKNVKEKDCKFQISALADNNPWIFYQVGECNTSRTRIKGQFQLNIICFIILLFITSKEGWKISLKFLFLIIL